VDPSKKEALKMFWTYSHEQGMQEGLQQGMQQGMQQHAIAHVERFARRRSWDLDAETMARVQGLTVAQLDSLSDAMLDFASRDDVDRWLAGCLQPACE
jgi:flagellar biosynthesis/type III secretory pathway protein FliH